MPYKFLQSKDIEIAKQKYRVKNWADYNNSLKSRGRIDTYITPEAAELWYEKERVYIGAGSTRHYTDFAILTCHELRLVFKLPLRQAEGFINSIFDQLGLDISCSKEKLV